MLTKNINHHAEIFSILSANQFAASEVTAMNNSNPFSSLQSYREFVKASGINQTKNAQPSTSSVQPTSQAVDSISKSMFSTIRNLFLGSPERDFDANQDLPWPWTASRISASQLRPPYYALPSYSEENMLVFGDLSGQDLGKTKTKIRSEVVVQDDDSSSGSSVHSIPASPEHEVSQSKAESPVKTKKASSSRGKPLDWKFVTQHVIVQTGTDQRVKQAIRNLFIPYSHSPTFRDVVQRLHETGGVKVVDSQETRKATYLTSAQQVLLNIQKLKTDPCILAKLVFELFNAYHTKQFIRKARKTFPFRGRMNSALLASARC